MRLPDAHGAVASGYGYSEIGNVISECCVLEKEVMMRIEDELKNVYETCAYLMCEWTIGRSGALRTLGKMLQVHIGVSPRQKR